MHKELARASKASRKGMEITASWQAGTPATGGREGAWHSTYAQVKHTSKHRQPEVIALKTYNLYN
jgi:hypothetical protein